MAATKSKAKTALQPLADRIVITPLKQEEVTASGLVIPDTAKEKPQQGEVVAVGPGKLDGTDYIVLNEKDILAKLVV